MNALGYKVSDGHLEVDENEAPLIRRIYRLYTEDRLSGWRIAELLHQQEIRTSPRQEELPATWSHPLRGM